MSTQRRPGSRRPSTGAAARGGTVAGTIDGPVDEAPEAAAAESPEALSSAAIRAARAEERRVRLEEPVRRSALADQTGRLRRLYDDTRAEIKKISWPDRETTRNLTVVVIGISFVLGVVLGGIDFVLFQIFEALP